MDNQKYLVIITLIDGQNFTVPSGAPDKIEATVFAEARFGNESVLRSAPIKLVNSNPEFITELAWQLDKKSLHQLRVERKAIKLQVFMQTKERKKATRLSDTSSNSANDNKSDETNNIELIGYTILDLRSAQEIEQPNHFKWCPLLNPKFRKSSYNRPEIQLAITLNRLDEETNRDDSNQFSSICSLPDGEQANESLEFVSTQSESREHNYNNSTNGTSKLYTTCLDVTMNSESLGRDQIIDNDIIVRSLGGIVYVYDANSQKSSLEDCNEKYRLIIRIPFSTGLDALVGEDQQGANHYFSINLFGSTFKTPNLDKAKEMIINIMTTHPAALATYFELNSDLDLRFHRASGEMLGLSTIQLNQLCTLDLKCRSIEGIFALQSLNDDEHYPSPPVNPSIGVSVVLEKVDSFKTELQPKAAEEPMTSINERSRDTLDDRLINSVDNTHQVTLDESSQHNVDHEIYMEDHNPGEDDHHYRFTIDLKKFSYTPSQRLIPMLRELVISYSYQWFGYVDKITTETSIPINATSSIIVAGFCEFNFAHTSGPLLTALSEIPLNLDILAVDETRLKELDNKSHGRVVATCSVNLAEILGLHADNINQIGINGISTTSSVPIFAISDGQAIGELQIYLSLRDLGKPAKNLSHGASFENLCENYSRARGNSIGNTDYLNPTTEICRLDNLISETKKSLESWTEDNFNKLADELRRRETERFKRISQRIEAKEAKRDLEFKKKLDDLNNLEKKFLHSLANVDCLEKMLTESIEHLKNKNANLDDRLNMLEQKISQTACNGHATNHLVPISKPREDHVPASRNEIKTIPYWARNVQISPRRANPGGCNLPVRSSSLVRAPESTTVAPKQVVVRRATGPVPTTNLRSVNSRVRSNSAKISLSRDTLEKLSGSRKASAQLR